MSGPGPVDLIYVDDEPLLCDLFAEHMLLDNLRVLTFTDPRTALAHLNASLRPCGALFLDFQMGDMDGYALFDALVHREYPVFLISGHADAQLVKTAAQKGFAKTYFKPVSYRELLSDLKAFVL